MSDLSIFSKNKTNVPDNVIVIHTICTANTIKDQKKTTTKRSEGHSAVTEGMINETGFLGDEQDPCRHIMAKRRSEKLTLQRNQLRVWL